MYKKCIFHITYSSHDQEVQDCQIIEIQIFGKHTTNETIKYTVTFK